MWMTRSMMPMPALLVIVSVMLGNTAASARTMASQASALSQVHISSHEFNDGSGIDFNTTFSSNMVLQQAPHVANIFGTLRPSGDRQGADAPTVTVSIHFEETAISDKASVSGPSATNPKSYKIDAQVYGPSNSLWKATLRPQEARPIDDTPLNVTITVTCSSGCSNNAAGSQPSMSLYNVTFGDVYFCSGQSNMWLPILHTFSRNKSVEAIASGQYTNIHIKVGNASQVSVDWPWMTLKQAIADGTNDVPTYTFFQFSSTCYYFAESLTEQWIQQGMPVIPIGLIHTAIGGTQIEQWMTNSTIEQCNNTLRNAGNQGLYDGYVLPFAQVTVKAFLWYQAASDMEGVKGNSLYHRGYGCLMPKMVALWRSTFSKAGGSTDPTAPFFVVTLAPGESEGYPDIAAMRWSQSANYGVLPNPLIPNAHLIQAFDLGDPWTDWSVNCINSKCCVFDFNATSCDAGTNGHPEHCQDACQAQIDTNIYMGPIHPRDKKILGSRIATSAMAALYTHKGPTTGPTVSGCRIDAVGKRLIISFNTSLLAGDKLHKSPYNVSVPNSNMRLLNDPNYFCIEPALHCKPFANGTRPAQCDPSQQEWYCPRPDGSALGLRTQRQRRGVSSMRASSAPAPPNPYDSYDHWIAANISLHGDNQVAVDLSAWFEGSGGGSGGSDGKGPYAVRYAWSDDCCFGQQPWKPCVPGSCPLYAAKAQLPANPFMARIENGACVCVPPQQC